MNNTVIINGSPKAKDSLSGMLIGQLESISGTKYTVYQARKLVVQDDLSMAMDDIIKANTLIFVFPLYVDSLPAPLIKLLTLIGQAVKNANKEATRVYAICNCGFYEAGHTRLALNIIKNFADGAGMTWGYGIGIGCGGFIGSQRDNMSRGKGPAANVYIALKELCTNMQTDELAMQDQLITPKIPRFLYKIGGNMSWKKMAKKYNMANSLDARPHQ